MEESSRLDRVRALSELVFIEDIVAYTEIIPDLVFSDIEVD